MNIQLIVSDRSSRFLLEMSKRGGDNSVDGESAKKQRMEDDGMSKPGGENGGDSESAKKQKMEDDEHSVELDNVYQEATKFRSFKLIVEGKSIFVNPHFLGDFSPFFDTLCLSQSSEAQKGEAELKDAKYDDVIEMLNVLGADTRDRPKDIDMSNCAPMLLVAEKWDIKALRRKCKHFIKVDFINTESNFSNTMKILVACESCFVPLTVLHIVASRLAAFGRRMLMQQQVGYALESVELFVAILTASTQLRYNKIPDLDHDYSEDVMGPCRIPGCDKMTAVCECCGHAECSGQEFLCPEKASNYLTDHIEPLRHDFFMSLKPCPQKLY